MLCYAGSMSGESSIELNGQTHAVAIRRSHRARHLILRLTTQGTIELVVPRYVSFKVGEQFLRDRTTWLIEQFKHHHAKQAGVPQYQFITGEQLPYLGQQLRLFVETDSARHRSRITRRGDTLDIQVKNQAVIRGALINWYKAAARQYFTSTAAAFAHSLNTTVTRITIGDFRSQWGSCTRQGRLAFSWRLLLAPEPVAAYVAAHEVAHLKHANHAAHFWATVSQLHPSYKATRGWLRRHAHTLVF